MLATMKDAREYLESFIKPIAFIPSDDQSISPLQRMELLLTLLGNPEKKFKSVQVSGTSGKGSTAYLTANMLTKAGYKTGLTVSPHLEYINERIQINMQMVSDQQFMKLTERLRSAIDDMQTLYKEEPSYFEVLVALAFLHFADERVDIAIVEVGLEGRYDATNVLDPLLVVLTSISKDHTELLGETVDEIATEVMSVIEQKPLGSLSIVTGIHQPHLRDRLKSLSVKMKHQLSVFGEDMDYICICFTDSGSIFSYRDADGFIENIRLSLRGQYQVINATLALRVIRELSHLGYEVSEEAIREGLATAHFAGRFEVMTYKEKTIIIDGAHNEEKMTSFLNALKQYYPNRDVLFIIGFKKRKDIQVMLHLLSQQKGRWVITEFHKTADYSRSVSMSLDEIKKLGIHKKESVYMSTVPQALTYALKQKETIIVITGSLYLAGEARSFFTEQHLSQIVE